MGGQPAGRAERHLGHDAVWLAHTNTGWQLGVLLFVQQRQLHAVPGHDRAMTVIRMCNPSCSHLDSGLSSIGQIAV